MRVPGWCRLAIVVALVVLAGCQKPGGLQPAGWAGSGGTSAKPAEPDGLLARHATLLRDRLSGEDLEALTRDWPRATELPGRPETWMRVALRDPAGAAPDGFRYAAMVDRGDPYLYWIEVSSSARGILEYRGPARID